MLFQANKATRPRIKHVILGYNSIAVMQVTRDERRCLVNTLPGLFLNFCANTITAYHTYKQLQSYTCLSVEL